MDLGPSPDRSVPRANEDTEFARRLIKAGESLRYEPLALVHHGIPQARINKHFLLSRWFDFGRASIVERDDHPDVLGIPWDYLSLMRRCVEISAMSVRWVVARRAHTRFFWRCMIWKEAGMMSELYRRLVGGKVGQTAAL